MINRAELKGKAREIISRKLGKILLVTVLSIIISGGFLTFELLIDGNIEGIRISIFSLTFFSSTNADSIDKIMQYFGIIQVISVAFSLFLLIPLSFGITKYFYNSLDDKESAKDLLAAYGSNFGKIVMTNLCVGFFIAIGFIFFIIPGVIAALMFTLLNYVLIDYPDLSFMETLKKARELTHGYKWELFILNLSFILWMMLSIVTFGLSNLWVSPYIEYTYIYTYKAIRAEKEQIYESN